VAPPRPDFAETSEQIRWINLTAVDRAGERRQFLARNRRDDVGNRCGWLDNFRVRNRQ
jgi:hypothetical protein